MYAHGVILHGVILMNRTTIALAKILLICLISSATRGEESDIRIAVSGASGAKPADTPAASPHLLRLEKVAINAFSPDGKLFLTVGEEDKQVHLWNTESGEEANRFGDAVTHAIFSGKGSRVMTWGEDGVTRIFDVRTGKALRRLEGAGNILAAAALSPDGLRALTCASDETVIKIWDTASGKVTGTLDGHGPAVTALAFSPDGRQAVSLSGPAVFGAGTPRSAVRAKGEKVTAAAASDTSLRLWDLETRKQLQKIDLPSPAQSPYFSADGNLLLVVINNAAKIYELASGKEITAPRTPEERFPAGMFTGDRKTGLSKALGSAAIINAADSQKIRQLDGPIDGMPLCNAFSEDGARLIIGTGKVGFFSSNPNEPGKVYVYDVASSKRLATFEGHGSQLTQVGFSVDSNRAFSRDLQKTVFLWAVPH
jgi:WD40 repeat protein